MGQAFRPSTLVPRSFVVDDVSHESGATQIKVRPANGTSACPLCGRRSERVHSHYQRCLADLPLAGQPVRLMVDVRRFYCDAVSCHRRIFTERFDEGVLAPGRGEPPASTTLSTILDSPWVGDRRQASPGG